DGRSRGEAPPSSGLGRHGGGRRPAPRVPGFRGAIVSLEPAPPPTFSRLGRVGAILAIVVLAGVAIVGGASFLGRQVGGALGGNDSADGVDVEPGLDVEIVVPSGASAQDIAAILATQGVVVSAGQFETTVRAA